ncbi:MAG: glycosyltransferase [Roseiflexaceae bacterium]|nr:glycosyltransferase [Roseiflexaceae bacterium]
MRSAVLVLTWNGGAEAIACLQRVRQLDPAPDVVLVVDNDSHDGTPDQIAALFPAFTLIRNSRNLGFAGGMNVGIRALLAHDPPPDIIVLLNQDTLVDREWLGAITVPFADPGVGAVGCKIRYPDGTIQHAGLTLDWPLALSRHIGRYEPDRGQYDAPRNVKFITFAAVALRRQALERVGLFDEGYHPAYFEDADLCVRLRRAGYRIRYEPRATLIHREATSQRDRLAHSALFHYGRLRFVCKTYPFDEITGPFAEAERILIERLVRFSEERALRWAYDRALTTLSDILRTRREIDPDPPSDALIRLRTLIFAFLHTVNQCVHRRLVVQAEDIDHLKDDPVEGFAARYTVIGQPPTRLDWSQFWEIAVEVQNIGSVSWHATGAHPVRLGYWWIDQSGATLAGRQRAALSRSVHPGDSDCCTLRIEPPPAPGRWRLQIGLVEEYIDSFSTYGVQPLDLDIDYVIDPTPRAIILSGSVAAHDALGSNILAQLQTLRAVGYRVLILAEHIDERLPADVLLSVVTTSRERLHEYPAVFEHVRRSVLAIVHYPVYYALVELIRDVSHAAIIFDYHGITPPEAWGVESFDYYNCLVRGIAMLSLVQYADYALGHSRFTCAELIATSLIDPERVVQIPCPIAALPALAGAPDPQIVRRFDLHNKHVLLYVGRIARNKRVHMLIEALPAIIARYPETLLMLVGDYRPPVYQQYVREAEARARELGVAAHVRFTGQVDDETLDQLYRACALFVTASIHEGFCMPVAEAMARGRPVVAARVTALPEIVGDAGLLFDPDDTAGLADQICRLLDELPPPGDHRDPLAVMRLAPAAEDDFARLRRSKIGIVTPRYGVEIVGGAESGIRGWAEQLAARGYTVEALTTTTLDMAAWGDHTPPGVEYLNGVTVRRFSTSSVDDRPFHALRLKVDCGERPRFGEEERFMEGNLRSFDLERFIAEHAGEYACLLVTPYLYGTSYWTIQKAPDRSILIPCLHDEPMARLSIVRMMLEKASALFFNSEEESDFATRTLGVINPYRACLGFGFPDHPEQGDPLRFRQRTGITGPMLLYAGRLELGKNVPLLIDYFVRYKAERPGPLTLALSGTGNVPLPVRSDIVGLGMLSREDLTDAYASALALCQLSLNESFSLVLMESWLQGRPVIVHSDCAVTRGHVERSGGGYAIGSYEEFRAAVDALLADKAASVALGERGKAYVLERYAWSRLLPRIEESIARFSRPRPLYARLAQRGVARALSFTRQRYDDDFLDLVERAVAEAKARRAHSA